MKITSVYIIKTYLELCFKVKNNGHRTIRENGQYWSYALEKQIYL